MNDPREALYTTPAMDATFAPEAHVQAMLAFEAALARAEAAASVIPRAAADAIEKVCRGQGFDVAAIYFEAARAGTPVIPLVRMLGERVGTEGRAFVHLGATSQDVIDTATVLQMRDGLTLLEADLRRVGSTCAALAREHRHTVMAGRTLLQQALPITFGLKAARWLGLVTRRIVDLRLRRQALALQFGGAAGTLASLGDDGMRVANLLAAELLLVLPNVPWHAERDRMADVAGSVALSAAAMGKIAQDILLLAQTEVGEVSEAGGHGKGGSSTMPHKRNQVDATLALAASRLATGQMPIILAAMTAEHERGAGGWQAEWPAIPNLFRFAGGAVARVATAVEGLEVHVDRMRSNLDLDGGLLMAEALATALTPAVGRAAAQHLVRAACDRAVEGSIPLRLAALENDEIHTALSPDAIMAALDPVNYLGSADVLIDRALLAYQAIKGGA